MSRDDAFKNVVYAYEALAARYHRERHGDTPLDSCTEFVCRKAMRYLEESAPHIREINDGNIFL